MATACKTSHTADHSLEPVVLPHRLVLGRAHSQLLENLLFYGRKTAQRSHFRCQFRSRLRNLYQGPDDRLDE